MHPKIKVVLQNIRLVFFKLIKNNLFLIKVYYFFTRDFDREIEYVHMGRIESLSSRYQGESGNPNLRRQLHRIEKGLNRPDRRSKFGSEPFDSVYNEFKKIKNLEKIDKNEIAWMIEVLTAYQPYSSITDHVSEILDVLKKTEKKYYTRNYATFLEELIVKRRSTRYFIDKEIDLKLICNTIEVAKEAPTACNRQPYSIHLINNKLIKEKIVNMAPGTAGFGDDIPLLAVVVGHASSFRFSRDRHLINFDSGLFVSQTILLLEEKGLNTCICNWTPDLKIDNAAIKLLGLDKSKTIMCLLAIGYGDQNLSRPLSYKKSNEGLIKIHD